MPIFVSFDAATIPGLTPAEKTSFAGDILPSQMAFFKSSYPARSIQLTTLQYGRPDGGPEDYQNYVNDAEWPNSSEVSLFNSNFNTIGGNAGAIVAPVKTATPRPRAYWRLMTYGTEYDRNRGMTMTSAEAVTKGLEDWSQMNTLRNDKTGKYPFASLPDNIRFGILTDIASREYAWGPIFPLAGDPKAGICRFGEFPLTSFPSLFGF